MDSLCSLKAVSRARRATAFISDLCMILMTLLWIEDKHMLTPSPHSLRQVFFLALFEHHEAIPYQQELIY